MTGRTDETGAERLHGLDALRGLALLGGVVLHATMSFFPGQQLWIVKDGAESAELAVMFYVLHIFRMGLFFLLAGFFGRMLLQRKGTAGFAMDRLRRIALPLASFWPIVFPLIVVCVVWAAIQANGGAPAGPPPPPPEFSLETFPLTHLWFLWVLLLFYGVALALRGAVVAGDRDGRLRASLDAPVGWLVRNWAPVLLAAPVAIMLATTDGWTSWFGIKTPDVGLVPNLQAVVAYGLAFGLGWLVQRQADLLSVWRRRWPFHLLLAAVFTVACLSMGGIAPSIAPAKPGAETWAYAVCYAMAYWSWIFGLVGLSLALFSNFSRARRWLADSSYWVYIMHLPVVMALQTAVAPLDWPWPFKFALVLGVAALVLFGSYQVLVRYSFIGRALNGRRKLGNGPTTGVEATPFQNQPGLP